MLYEISMTLNVPVTYLYFPLFTIILRESPQLMVGTESVTQDEVELNIWRYQLLPRAPDGFSLLEII